MTRLAWLLRRRGAAIASWLGAVLVAAALAFHWLAVAPLERRVDALERSRGAERDGRIGRMEDELSRPGTPRGQLAAFYAYFARGERLTDLLARLHAMAAASGIEMTRAEYRMLSQPDRKLDRYQIIVPVRGSYPVLRGFIAGVLRELPTASMDQIQFQRKAVGDDTVEAQITFVLHLAR